MATDAALAGGGLRVAEGSGDWWLHPTTAKIAHDGGGVTTNAHCAFTWQAPRRDRAGRAMPMRAVIMPLSRRKASVADQRRVYTRRYRGLIAC